MSKIDVFKSRDTGTWVVMLPTFGGAQSHYFPTGAMAIEFVRRYLRPWMEAISGE